MAPNDAAPVTASHATPARRDPSRVQRVIRLLVVAIVLLALGRASYHAVLLTEQAVRLSGGALR
jgi:hypothetical protein